MNRIFLIPFLVLGALMSGCRKNIDLITSTEKSGIPYEGVQSSLSGRILNPDGTPVAGASVSVDNYAHTYTNDQGLFFFYNGLMNRNGAH